MIPRTLAPASSGMMGPTPDDLTIYQSTMFEGPTTTSEPGLFFSSVCAGEPFSTGSLRNDEKSLW